MEDLRNESILEGIDIGDLRTTVKYYKKGKITLEEAAEDLNMTVEEFKEKMNQIPAEAVKHTSPLAHCVDSYMVRWWASFFVLTRINHRQHFGVFQSAVVAYAGFFVI